MKYLACIVLENGKEAADNVQISVSVTNRSDEGRFHSESTFPSKNKAAGNKTHTRTDMIGLKFLTCYSVRPASMINRYFSSRGAAREARTRERVRAGFKANSRTWALVIGAGFSIFIGKFILWQVVSDEVQRNRDEEHRRCLNLIELQKLQGHTKVNLKQDVKQQN